MNVGKEIGLLAKKQNVCIDFYKKMLKQTDISTLCRMYFEGSDWATENDFPDLETLRKFRGNSDRYGLYTDYVGEMSLENLKNQRAFFGNSDVDISAGGFSVSEIYIRHNSKARIKASGSAFMVINIFDSASVQIECEEDARVSVFYYGAENSVKYSGNVKITEKSWEK